MAQATDTARQVRAEAKYVRTSARKARLVLDHIRGRTVPEARTVLAFTPRAAAKDVEKVLRSAVANGEANHGLDGDRLVIVKAYADEGPTLKRWQMRARGRVNRIFKRTCHITIVLEQTAQPARPQRRAAKPAAEAAPAPAETPAEAEAPAEEKPKPKRRSRAKKEGAAV
jgi:ribosomal protein L22